VPYTVAVIAGVLWFLCATAMVWVAFRVRRTDKIVVYLYENNEEWFSDH